MKTEVVWFEGECVKCVMCVEEAPGVFDFVEEIGITLKTNFDTNSHNEGIKRAADICPTQRIKHRL